MVGGRIGLRMFIQKIAGTTIHTIMDTSNEEDPHVYNHISNPSYNQLHEYVFFFVFFLLFKKYLLQWDPG